MTSTTRTDSCRGGRNWISPPSISPARPAGPATGRMPGRPGRNSRKKASRPPKAAPAGSQPRREPSRPLKASHQREASPGRKPVRREAGRQDRLRTGFAGTVRSCCHACRMRPALKPGLLPVWRDRDTLQIGIDPRRAVALTGMAAAAWVISLLDGSRDRAQVIAAARDRGMPAELADRVLTLLAAGGALDDFPAGTYRVLSR